MSLSLGSHVGPYEVIAPLGEGAMGVVFRARDTRLQRDVALKLLPAHFANEPDRLSRFQREAQVLASLNHTNIAQIYGLEQVNGLTCIVMELVEGETLEEKLRQGPFSYEETVDIARQLSDALAVAHERGIVHRDLKPANIKLTPNGTVKVLDFGLAKALSPRASDTHMSVMPTMASGSIVGTIVGTPGYMSPEQARGKEVDARTDIWAFGCVIYEMLTGQQAFSGETITDVMAKVVTSPPDLNLLPKDTPSSIRLLLSAALNKTPSHRLQHIGDSRLFLDGPLVAETGKSNILDAPPRTGIRGKLLVATLIAALLIVAIPAALYFRGGEPQPEMQLEISFPGMVGQPVVSPNGRSVIYGSPSSNGKTSLWLRPMNSGVGQQLSGTENVNGAMWSPDSQKVLFISDGKIKKLDIAGGSTQSLGDMGATRGADWSRSGVMLFARVGDNVIVRMSETGGELTPVTKLDASKGEVLHALPVFLPDGNHFLYVAAGGKPEDAGVFLASIDSKTPPKRVIAISPIRFNAMTYLKQGYLLTLNSGVLTAHPMNSDGVPQGEPVLLAEDVETFTASQTGLLLYRKAQAVTLKQLVWFDRQGKQGAEVGAVANYGNVDLSAKGDRAAVDIIVNNNRDIWVVDLARDIPLRITFDTATDWSTSWSPDGTRIAFASTRPAGTQIYEKSSTGSGEETVLSPDEPNAIPVHWTPDAKYIVFSRPKQNSQNNRIYDTWLMPVSGERKAIPYLETGFDKFHARVSPDGRWIAYATNESGVYQVIVQTFPDPNGGKWQISAEGGVEPKWRRDSRELYYLGLDGRLMAVSVSGPAFQAGRPVALFQTPLTVNRNQPTRDRRYDVSPDGQFLIAAPAASSAPLPITVLVNWTARFEK